MRGFHPVRAFISRSADAPTLGITGRLALSFTAVAILAATANLIAERGSQVVRIVHLDRSQATPTSILPAAPAPSATAVRPPDAGRERTEAARLVWAAVEGLQRAVEVRAAVDSLATTADWQAATQTLADLSHVPQSVVPGLVPQITAYQKAGVDRVDLADTRRTLVHNYLSRTAAMDQRLSKSLDGAWKIFGRVLARQSLFELHLSLDEIRHRFDDVSAADGNSAAAAAALLASVDAYTAIFTKNQASFARSEGQAWVAGMREDFSQIAALRGAIGGVDVQARAAAARFSAGHDKLLNALAKPHTANDLTHGATIAPAAASAPALAGFAAMRSAGVASPLADTVTTTTTSLPDSGRKAAVAWVTAGVLVVLLLVSILTVRSILKPVGRMLKATEKLAAGDVATRVPRGGIKELDTLAIAFNRMAEQLSSAREMTRDYQQHLEEKIEQRTRQLQYHAEHDSLTLLPNRRQLFVLLNHSLQRASQNKRHVAVFFLDVDNFKNLNDGMGHAFGDKVLTGIAQRLKQTAEHYGFAARLGGDEFTIVYEEAESLSAITEAGRGLVASFEQPLLIEGREVVVSISVGASIFPEHGARAEDLLSAADAALYQAKALGRSQLALFTPALLETATRKFTIEQGVRRAIEHGEFELVFQPEVSLDTFQMVLAETLIRWRLPDGRHAPPGEFLAVTEETGLIIEVGNWVLRKAIETVARWYHGEWPEARIAINVSPRQLLDAGFVDTVQNLLREFQLPPRCIELELTESVLQTGPATLDALRRLKACDIAIALDDFGTGYSSLASLEHLPLSRIKLDRSLIAGIDTSQRSAAVTHALIGICEALDLEMTAEGVERPEQFAILINHRSINVQGYLISRPVLAEQVLTVRDSLPKVMQDLLLSIPPPRRETTVERPLRLRRQAANS